MIDICGVKNFCTVRKRQVFHKLKIFFILRNNHILTRVTIFCQRTSQIKVALNTFPDFADGSSHIIFKLSAWKRGCAIFFLTTNTADFINHSLKSSYKVLPRKEKIGNLQHLTKSLQVVEFFEYFPLTVQLLNAICHKIGTLEVIYLRIFTYTHAASFLKKLVSKKLSLVFDLKKTSVDTKIIPFSESVF